MKIRDVLVQLYLMRSIEKTRNNENLLSKHADFVLRSVIKDDRNNNEKSEEGAEETLISISQLPPSHVKINNDDVTKVQNAIIHCYRMTKNETNVYFNQITLMSPTQSFKLGQKLFTKNKKTEVIYDAFIEAFTEIIATRSII